MIGDTVAVIRPPVYVGYTGDTANEKNVNQLRMDWQFESGKTIDIVWKG